MIYKTYLEGIYRYQTLAEVSRNWRFKTWYYFDPKIKDAGAIKKFDEALKVYAGVVKLLKLNPFELWELNDAVWVEDFKIKREMWKKESNKYKNLQRKTKKNSFKMWDLFINKNVRRGVLIFNYFYIPVTCRFALIPKFMCDFSVSTRLINPLGHKNYRQYLKTKFSCSIKKGICISQLKKVSKQLILEKVKVPLTLNASKVMLMNPLKQISKLEKHRLIYFMLMHFQKDSSVFLKRALKTRWYSPLNKRQLYFLNPNQNQRFNCFINVSQLKSYFYQDLINGFAHKPHGYYMSPRVKFTFAYSWLPHFSKRIPWLTEQKEKLASTLTWPLMTKKIQNSICKWQRLHWLTWELNLFQRLLMIRRLLNVLICYINHKVDLFIIAFKPSLMLHSKEVKQINLQSMYPLEPLLDPLVKKQMSKILKLPSSLELSGFFDIIRAQINKYEYLQTLELPKLKRFKISLTSKTCIKQFANYFSFKTKLVKAKSVRLLLAYRLIARIGRNQPNLKQLMWLLNLNRKSLLKVLDFDSMLYNRLMINKRIPPKNPMHTFVGATLQNFLQHQPLYGNSYYLVKQGFLWSTMKDYGHLETFMSPRPGINDVLLSSYVERCITFDQPRTGAWAVETLLSKFKPESKTRLIQNQFANVKLKLPLLQYYCNNLRHQISYLNNTMVSIRQSNQKIRLFPGPVSPISYFYRLEEKIGYRFSYKKWYTLKRKLRIAAKRALIKLKAKTVKLTRRFKFVRPWLATKINPAWMILNLLPILPPEVRPVLPLSGGQFAMSDLNKLYQQVIYRNNRLKILPEFYDQYFSPCHRKSPSHAYLGFGRQLRLSYRLAQQAVDALMDNGKSDSTAVLNSRGQPLKSLAEMLRGKKGRFRQNLLGKRVDYSGRSVIVVGPQLHLHQCGLPKEMAIELFQPFLIRALITQGYAKNYIESKTLINFKQPIIWKLLKEIMQDRPILLNRAPTLHRLGIQAFQPLLVSGRTILLHPLVCSAFNADFDGDQMAVHVPLAYTACSEAWRLMWSCNNLFSPATGEPNLTPTQDMVLGCYYLSTWDRIKYGLTLQTVKPLAWFSQLNEVIQAVNFHHVELHQAIWLNWSKTVEFDLDYQTCLEFQLDPCGNHSVYYTNYICYDHKYKQNHWILTTPGRVLLNQLIFDLKQI